MLWYIALGVVTTVIALLVNQFVRHTWFTVPRTAFLIVGLIVVAAVIQNQLATTSSNANGHPSENSKTATDTIGSRPVAEEPAQTPATAVSTQRSLAVSASPVPTTTAPPRLQADYLFDLTPTDGSFEVGSKTVNGQILARSIFHGLSECNPGDGKGHSVEYDLGRKYSTFTAIAGLSDLDTHGSRTVQFRMDTDRGHGYFTSRRGESHKVKFDVGSALFLRLSVYEPNGSGQCFVDTVAVWGQAQIHR